MAFLEVRNLSKSFPSPAGARHVLSGVALDVDQGEFVSIVGTMGSGKSTLLSLLAGLTSPDGGTVVLDGKPVTGVRDDAAFVFQNYSLLPWFSALENVRLAVQAAFPNETAAEQTRRATEALERVGLGNALDRKPRQLSGGMRQRVSLIRTLVHDPSLLLMDEPFGALDALTRLQVRTDLEALWLKRRPTVLFITHSVEEAVGLSDRILVMSPSPGEVIEEIRVDIPRPRPIVLGDVSEFAVYVDRIHRHFERLGVLHNVDGGTH